MSSNFILPSSVSFFLVIFTKKLILHVSMNTLPLQNMVLTCIGEGPVVHIMPLDLDWKEITVLTDNSKIFRLSNESLIPAKFTAHMVRPNSVWRVEPPSGEIPAEDQLELTVTACLNDAIR